MGDKLTLLHGNNKDADQAVSTIIFVICSLESTVDNLTPCNHFVILAGLCS